MIFVEGRAFALNNDSANGVQFSEGNGHPILGDYVYIEPKSAWWAG